MKSPEGFLNKPSIVQLMMVDLQVQGLNSERERPIVLSEILDRQGGWSWWSWGGWTNEKAGFCAVNSLLWMKLGGGNSNLGKISNLTHIFQMGWNHQLANVCWSFCLDRTSFGLSGLSWKGKFTTGVIFFHRFVVHFISFWVVRGWCSLSTAIRGASCVSWKRSTEGGSFLPVDMFPSEEGWMNGFRRVWHVIKVPNVRPSESRWNRCFKLLHPKFIFDDGPP